MDRVVVLRELTRQHNGRIAAQTGGLVHGVRIDAATNHIALGANDEENGCLLQAVQPGEIQKAAIHDVKAARFRHQDVEHIDLVHLAVADMDEAGDVAAQIEQGVHLDCGFGRTEVSHGKTERHRSMVVVSSA